ncbi:hypothetical protein [Halomarina oriensis]|uniref:Uncharacterized protein n=1 Tax=Halomarina oriensis TaxID=671145 RepID=A0A6B0GI50_9EURY|nr:hypothetical protein [Halomarina oriensis]MWG34546.1 hypothetical protein [Halomarina oriensis]
MSIRLAIDDLDAEFQTTPLDFTVEAALQARLLTLLRRRMGESIRARGGYDLGDVTGYKRKYLDRIAAPHEISNVQAEVNFGTSGVGNTSLDVAVLDPEASSEYAGLDCVPESDEPVLTVRLVDGSKYFPAGAIEHAIELKYIKNVDVAGAAFENPDIDEWPHFSADLRKLGALDGADSRHLVVVTNKNPFQQGETDDRSTEKARQRFDLVREECRRSSIELTEIHPR